MAVTKLKEHQQRIVFLLKPAASLQAYVLLSGPSRVVKVAIPSAEEAILISLPRDEKPAAWTTLFSDQADPDLRALLDTQRSRSTSAVLLIRTKKANFALPFGSGHTLLNDQLIDDTFGFRVALNLTDKNLLRSLDRSSLDVRGHKTREQTPSSGSIEEFAVDFDRDLIQAVAGIPADSSFGRSIAGLDSLSVRLPNASSRLVEPLLNLHGISEREDYKEKFPGVDKIKAIRNPDAVAGLDEVLLEALIQRNTSKVWLAAPEISDYQKIAKYRLSGVNDRSLRDDIYIKEFLELAQRTGELSIEKLKAWTVEQLDGNDQRTGRWSVYKCLYAELAHDGRVHILNSGQWYSVDFDFVSSVNDFVSPYLQGLHASFFLPPYNHESEGHYNTAVAKEMVEFVSLDADLISHGGNRVEVCDLLSSAGAFVHVKRYSGSATLSHLFKQACVSAELLSSDEAFRAKVNEKNIPSSHRVPQQLANFRSRTWTVCFAIIAKETEPLRLPFFSKVALKSSINQLVSMHFQVELLAVQDVKNTVGKRKPVKMPRGDWDVDFARSVS